MLTETRRYSTLQIEILRLFGQGLGLKAITLQMKCADAVVADLITGIQFNRQYARELARRAEAGLPPAPPAVPPSPVRRAVPPQPAPEPAPPATPDPEPTMPDPTTATIDALIDRAHDSGLPRAVRLADRITDLATELETLLDRTDRERDLLARIAELDAQRTAARAELAALTSRTPAPPTTDQTSPPAAGGRHAAIRTWATAQGMRCSATGRIPAAVLTAYEAAHPGEATP